MDMEYKETRVSPKRFWTLCVGVALGLCLAMMDSSIVATSIVPIGVEFHNLRSVNWIALAYTLAYLGCAVSFARISDIVGRRYAYTAAFILFFAFSLACGFAQSLDQLIAFRAIQGVGGSGLYSLSMIILSELVPPGQEKYIGALIGMVVASSGIMGPVLGGILNHFTSWRWIFWINGPAGLVSVTIFLVAWPKSDDLPTFQHQKWRQFDLLGSILVVAASCLLVFSFQNAGENIQGIWQHAVFIGPLVAGIICWVLLAGWEFIVTYKLSNILYPVFPISLFTNRYYTGAALTTLFMGFPFILLLYLIPLRAQVVSGKNTLVSGIMLLPMLGSSAVGTVVSARINGTKHFFFETMLAGSCLMTIGCGLMSTVGTGEDAKLLGVSIFAGFGFGISVTATTMVQNYEAPIRHFAPAQGIIAQLRILGGSFGISASTSLVNVARKKYLTGVLSPMQQQTLGQGGQPLEQVQIDAIHQAYTAAFQNSMIACTVVSGVAIVAAFISYRPGPRPVAVEARQKLVEEERARRRALSEMKGVP